MNSRLLLPSLISGLFALALSNLSAESVNIKSPGHYRLAEKETPEIKELKQLLQKKDLVPFYRKADTLLSPPGSWDLDALTQEQLTEALWIFYHISSAPLFPPLDFDENVPCPWEDCYNDFDVKAVCLPVMLRYTLDPKKITNKKKIAEKNYRDLLASFATRIMADLSSAYDKKYEEKEKQHQELLKKRTKKWLEENPHASRYEGYPGWRDFENKMVTEKNRNISAWNRFQTSENTFVSLLVNCYPDDRNNVWSHLLMAGFTEEEIPALIDRTVGRDAKTEFLYKGRKAAQKPERDKRKK